MNSKIRKLFLPRMKIGLRKIGLNEILVSKMGQKPKAAGEEENVGNARN